MEETEIEKLLGHCELALADRVVLPLEEATQLYSLTQQLYGRVRELESVVVRISNYLSPGDLLRSSESEYGLDYTEALGMAYENIIQEAMSVLPKKKRGRNRARP